MENKIKLIIIDLYGVMTHGDYNDTCRWISKKYKLDYEKVFNTMFYKYFCKAAMGKMKESDAFRLTVKDLGMEETPRQLREKHLSFLVLNKSVFKFSKELRQRGYKILLLSKNAPGQFKAVIKKYQLNKITTTHIL